MSYARQLDRRELVLAVWAAEFARALRGGSASSAAVQRRLAHLAAKSADRAVTALHLLVDGVEFRLASPDDLDDCYMTWEEFVDACRGGGFTDDDGHGALATADRHVSNVRVYPGAALSQDYVRPDWATHVCWYNK